MTSSFELWLNNGVLVEMERRTEPTPEGAKPSTCMMVEIKAKENAFIVIVLSGR
jgi:hypothetical protein